MFTHTQAFAVCHSAREVLQTNKAGKGSAGAPTPAPAYGALTPATAYGGPAAPVPGAYGGVAMPTNGAPGMPCHIRVFDTHFVI